MGRQQSEVNSHQEETTVKLGPRPRVISRAPLGKPRLDLLAQGLEPEESLPSTTWKFHVRARTNWKKISQSPKSRRYENGPRPLHPQEEGTENHSKPSETILTEQRTAAPSPKGKREVSSHPPERVGKRRSTTGTRPTVGGGDPARPTSEEEKG